MPEQHAQRRERLRRRFRKAEIDALLVTNFTNVTYLTGFTGDDSYFLVRNEGEVVVSDPRYTTQLSEESPDVETEIRRPGVSMLKALARLMKPAGRLRLGIEADSIPLALREQIGKELPHIELRPTSRLIESLRSIKDAGEIQEIRHAVQWAQRAFAVLRATLQPEKTERQLRNELEYQMRLFGAEDRAFPSIVAVGPRAALPHARPGDSQVCCDDLLLVDWGASGPLYKSDLTRVLVTGRISPKLERVYRVVLNAQLRAIEEIRPGVEAKAVDSVAREAIAEAGFGRYFGHGLGHGLGLEVHEAPRLAAKSADVLRAGMVVTVEPGIYIPGWGGVRIEDDVLVTRDGHEVLTSLPKELEDAVVV